MSALDFAIPALLTDRIALAAALSQVEQPATEGGGMGVTFTAAYILK